MSNLDKRQLGELRAIFESIENMNPPVSTAGTKATSEQAPPERRVDAGISIAEWHDAVKGNAVHSWATAILSGQDITSESPHQNLRLSHDHPDISIIQEMFEKIRDVLRDMEPPEPALILSTVDAMRSLLRRTYHDLVIVTNTSTHALLSELTIDTKLVADKPNADVESNFEKHFLRPVKMAILEWIDPVLRSLARAAPASLFPEHLTKDEANDEANELRAWAETFMGSKEMDIRGDLSDECIQLGVEWALSAFTAF